MEWIAVVGAIGACSSILFGYIGYQKGLKKDCKQEGVENGVLHADIEYIKRRSDDTLLEVKETNKGLNALAERVARVEESAKQAHKRIDGIIDKKEA